MTQPSEKLRGSLDQLPDPLPITPVDSRSSLAIAITPPGSKSLTNRFAILAALSKGESTLRGVLRSDDCDRMFTSLHTLGSNVSLDGDVARVHGQAGQFDNGGALNLGEGGTPARFLIAAACLAQQPVTIDGCERLRERPIVEGVQFLNQLGANIESVNQDDHLPVAMTPSAIGGGTIRTSATSSSQFLSALMLIAPALPQGVTIECSEPPTSASYLYLTKEALREWGCTCSFELDDCGQITRIHVPHQELVGKELTVAADASSAVPWWCAAALVPDASVTTNRINGIPPQPDELALQILESFGCHTRTDDSSTTVVNTSFEQSQVTGQVFDLSDCPDAAMSLGVVAAGRGMSVRLTGLHTLRVKECDRLVALHSQLQKCGCIVEHGADSIVIDGHSMHDHQVTIDTFNDHRVAMAFAALGLSRGNIAIENPACVAKSYPGFWRDLARLYD